MNTHAETLGRACRAAAWRNELHHERDAMGNIILSVSPQFALEYMVKDPYRFYNEAAAIESMQSSSNCFNVPMRLWKFLWDGRYFYTHASLDAAAFGCDYICTAWPMPIAIGGDA